MTTEKKKKCGFQPGKAHPLYSHGESGTPLYEVWKTMKQRCSNPNVKGYDRWGGRGIRICPEWWHSFKVFSVWAWANGYAEDEELSIDRIDNNKGYFPENCRFATNTQQVHNRRMRSDNKSGLTGVNWYKNYQKWQAQLLVDGKKHNLGYFDCKYAAGRARDRYIIENDLPHKLNDESMRDYL